MSQIFIEARASHRVLITSSHQSLRRASWLSPTQKHGSIERANRQAESGDTVVPDCPPAAALRVPHDWRRPRQHCSRHRRRASGLARGNSLRSTHPVVEIAEQAAEPGVLSPAGPNDHVAELPEQNDRNTLTSKRASGVEHFEVTTSGVLWVAIRAFWTLFGAWYGASRLIVSAKRDISTLAQRAPIAPTE